MENEHNPNNTAGAGQEKLFTQEDVNRIVGERLARMKNENGVAESYRLERDEALKKLQQYENNAFLREKGVPADYMEFVSFMAEKNVNAETTFQEAAAQFLKENPRYAGSASRYRVLSSSTGSNNFSRGGTKDSDDPAEIRKAMGLKG